MVVVNEIVENDLHLWEYNFLDDPHHPSCLGSSHD